MPEITIRYKNNKALKAIKELAKYFDIVLEKPVKKATHTQADVSSLPVDFASKPDVTALAGIWKDKNISLDDLRKKAWSDR